MAQEESILGCSYSGGGSGGAAPGGGGSAGRGGACSRSKKVKQKKVPQRGLGVAQLEKIRMEEQQKKESLQAANILAKNAVGSASDSAPFLAVQKFRSNLSHFHNSVPNLEILQENSSGGGGGGEIESKAILSPRLWGGEYSVARLDQHGFAFDPNLNLSYENTPVLPRSNQFHQPTSSSSVLQVNSSPGIQPSSQSEPPSNQSFRSSSYAPLWTEEEKMVGMKRSYPFSLDSPPAPSFSFHPIYAASSKSDELALCSNGYSDRMDPKSQCIRDGPSSSSPLPEKKPNEAIKDDGRLNGDFLTLAPPSEASPPLIAKHKVFPGYSGYHGQEYECRTSQDYGKSHLHQPGSSGSVEAPFSFFPMKQQSCQTSTDASSENGDKGEAIDLNLKL